MQQIAKIACLLWLTYGADARTPRFDWDAQLAQSFPQAQEQHRIPGGALAIIDGDLVLTRAFGLADVETGRAVTTHTPFYLASTGKLFTALAVLALVESERVSLHEDVNGYLRTFQVKNDGFGALTLHNLLTHTAGLDDRLIGYAARSAETRRPLGQYLVDRLPPRVRPPGGLISYSNHGFGLAGHVVETVSGQSFSEFVAGRILEPLNMHDSGYLPAPDGRPTSLARSYSWNGEPRALGYSNVTPAGGIAASADDLARLMRALLHPGPGKVAPETVEALTSRQAAHHPQLAGRGYALWEHRFGEETGWVIGGAAYGYSSAIVVLPDRHLAAAVLFNRQEPGRALELIDGWIRWRLGIEELTPHSTPLAGIDALSGTYRWVRYGSRSVERLVGHFMELTVEAVSASTLLLVDDSGESRWAHIGDGVFVGTDDPSLRLAFDNTRDPPGYLYSNHILTMPTAFERVHPLDTRTSRALQVVTTLAIAFVAVAAFGVTGWRARRTGTGSSVIRRLGVLLAVSILTFAVLAVLALRNFLDNLVYGPNAWLRVATLWPTVIALLWAAFLVRVVIRWPQRTLVVRIGYLWLLASGLGTLALAWHYHWWGWNF